MIKILFSSTLILLLFILKCVLIIQVICEGGDPLEHEYGTIRHASVLFRHGDRSPINSFPLDPYKNYHWPGGYGQLLNAGKQRMVYVGKWFRIRYQNLIDSVYSPKHIRVESSDLDRCIMSAQCFLYAFYPAMGEQRWLEDEKWQPIPVHTIPTPYDNKIHLGKECMLRMYLKEKKAADPKYERIYDEYRNIIPFISEKTGLDFKNASKVKIIDRLRQLRDTLLVYVQNNLTLPDWTKNIYPGALSNIPESLNNIVLKTYENMTYSIQGIRLNAGPFLESVVADMSNKIQYEDNEQKLHLYSGHDTTIMTIMLALMVHNNLQPPYGSSLIFELRKKNSTNYVTISYLNDTEKPAHLLNIPGCGFTCTFEQFYSLTKPLIPENWDEECESMSGSSAMITVNAIVIPISIYILFVLK